MVFPLRSSITLRLSLLFALLLVATLAGVGAYLFHSLEERMVQRNAAELAGKVELVRYILSGLRDQNEVLSSREQLTHVVVGHPSLYLAVLEEAGRVLFASSDLRPPQALLRSVAGTGAAPQAISLWRPRPDLRYRAVAVWADLAPGSGSRVLVVLGLDTREQHMLLSDYRRTLIIALLVAGSLTALMGVVVTRHGLRPLRDIVAAAHRISANALSARLDAERAPAEVKQLAHAFNAMLARLEDSFTRLAAFSSDLAHELRTPVNNLMGQTQVALTRPRAMDEYRRVLESNLEELDRLSRIITNMLFLARADHAQIALKPEALDLHAELDKVAEFYEAHAEEHGVRIDRAGGGRMTADRMLVQRAIGNILSNAIRHTPPGGEIKARVARAAGFVTLSVSNPGPGIPVERLPWVFDRFHRLDRTGDNLHDGAGLGLAIVKSVMQLHGGHVTVESVPGGDTTFTLHFPHQSQEN